MKIFGISVGKERRYINAIKEGKLDFYLSLIELLTNEKRLHEASEIFMTINEKRLRLNSDGLELKIDLASALFNAKKFEDAEKLYKQILDEGYKGKRKENVERQYCILIRKFGREGREFIRQEYPT